MLKTYKILFTFKLFIFLILTYSSNIFADKAPLTGRLEFKVVYHDTAMNHLEMDNQGTSKNYVQALVDSIIRKNKIKKPYTAKGMQRINQALQGKIPPQTRVYLELPGPTNEIKEPILYILYDKVELSGEMLRRVEYSMKDGFPAVILYFNQEGKSIFANLTSKNDGQDLAILVDDNILSVPRIHGPIPNGIAMISFGSASYGESSQSAHTLVNILRNSYHLEEDE